MGTWCEVTCDFYSERRLKARKQHTCCETGRIIQPGEHYWRCVGSWEGQFESFAQSEAAWHFSRWYNRLDSESPCVGFRGIHDDMRNTRDAEDPIWEEWEKVKRGIITRPGA